MRKLRQKYDNIHKTVISKEKELETLRVRVLIVFNFQKRLELMKNDEAEALEAEQRKGSDLRQIGDGVQEIIEKHEFELMLQRTYKHMITRMQNDLIAEQIRATELQESYKSKLAIAEEESEKNRKAKQQRMQAHNRLEEFMRMIDQDHFTRQKRIGSLSKSIKNKELALERRIERHNR